MRLEMISDRPTLRPSVGVGDSGIDVAALQAGRQPFLALVRGAVGEAVGHRVGPRDGGLQPVVADRLRRRQRAFDVAGLKDLPFVVGVVGPHAGQAVGLQLDPDGQRVGLSLAHPLLHVVDLVENPQHVLHVMADLVRHHIGISEFTAAAVLVFHVAKEGVSR